MDNQKGYLFICNSTKPSEEKYLSRDPVTIDTFGYAPIKAAETMGYKLFYGVNRKYAAEIKCTNFDITFYDAQIFRNVFAFRDNWRAYKNLCNLMDSNPGIEVIHCNTPIGGVLGRICGHKYHKKVIYTAHGFHFYKGAPLYHWLLFYPIEKFLARWTDALITINAEDFEAAKRFKFKKGGKVFKVNGVGVNLNSFNGVSVNVKEKRESLDLPENAVVGIVVGDLNNNKNVGTIIRALPLADGNIHIIICGFGPLESTLKKLAKDLGVDERCHFLGFRTDVKELYLASDIFIFASQREGLPRSTMEAMLAGLPCVVSKIRGNVDLIDEGKGGLFFSPKDYNRLAEEINMLAGDLQLRTKYGHYNQERIKQYDIEVVKQQMLDIYIKVI